MRPAPAGSLAAGLLATMAPAARGGLDEKEHDAATASAAVSYEEARARGDDMTDGPCIADPLESMPGWVVDVTHAPREDVDDEPANQCSSYRSGDAGHLVELDPDGNLIRAR